MQSIRERCGYSTVENGDNNDLFYFSKHDGSFERAQVQPMWGTQSQVGPPHLCKSPMMLEITETRTFLYNTQKTKARGVTRVLCCCTDNNWNLDLEFPNLWFKG